MQASRVLKFMVVGYMFIFLCRIFEEYPVLGAIHLERVWMLLLLFVFFSAKGNELGKFRGKLGPSLLLFAVIFSFLGCIDASDWATTTEAYVKLYIYYFIIASIIDEKDMYSFIIASFVFIMLIYELKSLSEFFFHGRYVYRMGIIRLIGLGSSLSDPNAFAGSVCLVLPFGYALFTDKLFCNSQRRRLLLITFFVASVVCIVLTGSRTGLATLCMLIFLLWLKSAHKMRSMVALLILATVTWFAMPADKQERILSTLQDEPVATAHISERQAQWAQASAESRLTGFLDGFNLMLMKPLTGFGAGNFAEARGLVGELGGMQAHNLYGQLMGDLGLVGVFAWLVLVTFLIRRNLWLLRNDACNLSPYARACIVGVLVLLMHGIASHNLYRFNWLWFAAFTSAAWKINQKALDAAAAQRQAEAAV